MSATVGVTQRVFETQQYVERRDMLSHDWISLLTRLGLFPLLVPNSVVDLDWFLQRAGLTHILLTNGNDVCAEEGEDTAGLCDISIQRDETEQRLIEHGLEHGLPIFGVCRGLQLLNRFFSGSIVRDLTKICGSRRAHVATNHRVDVIDQRWQQMLGASFETNSYHQNAVTRDTLSDQLVPVAVAQAGVVEAFCHPRHAILAIQWHPERKNPASDADAKMIEAWLAGTRYGDLK